MKNWRMLIFSIAMTANTAFGAPRLVDKVTAIVNNDIILESDVNKILPIVKIRLQQSGEQIPNDKILYQQILEQQVIENIFLQISKKIGIKITDQQLDQAIQNIAESNHISLIQLHNNLLYRGINYKDYREQIRKEMLIENVRDNTISQLVTIIPQEVDTLATQLSNQNLPGTQLNLSQILIPLPKKPTQQQVNDQETLAYNVTMQLKNGADFNKFAELYSGYSNNAGLNSSNIGWNKIENLPNLFLQALHTAKKGDIVGPISSDIGFFILKVNDLRKDYKKVFVKEVHARHILLKPSPLLTDIQARAKLEQIITDIKDKKITFAKAAKNFSDDTATSEQGGDLGWIELEIYEPKFSQVLLKLNKGQISKPIHSTFGWHIVQLLDARQVNKTATTVKKELAYHLLFNKKYSEEMKVWIQQQLAKNYVKIIDNND